MSKLAPPTNRRYLLPIGLLLLFGAAFLIRVWGLSWFHYWDEWVYLQNAKVICCGKTNYSELSFRPPLLSLLFAAAFLIRDHIFSACIAAAALNALAPVLLFLSGRRIVGWLPAALASLLLAFGPFFVGVFPTGFESDDTGNSLLTDSPALTLILLGLWLMLKALRNQQAWRFALAGFALSLAVLMRFGSLPSVGILCLLPLAATRRWTSLAATAAGLLTGLAPYLLWSRLTYHGFFETLRQAVLHVEGPSPAFTFYLVNAPTIFTWTALIGLLIALAATLSSLHKRRHPTAVQLAPTPAVLRSFLWLWLVAALLFFSRMPHKEPRYILPLAPPLLLLSGSGLALLARLPGRFLRPTGIVLLAAGMTFALVPSLARLHRPFIVPGHPEELDAALYLESSFAPTTPLYMNFNYPAFAYFTSYTIHELPVGGPKLYQAIDNIPVGGILVAYRQNESGDPKIELLNHDPALEPLKEYSTLVIYSRLQTP